MCSDPSSRIHSLFPEDYRSGSTHLVSAGIFILLVILILFHHDNLQLFFETKKDLLAKKSHVMVFSGLLHNQRKTKCDKQFFGEL